MRVYVFGKFQDKRRVREVQAKLIEAGHTITHDWTTHNSSLLRNPEKRRISLTQDAINDTEGVRRADIGVGVFIAPLPYEGPHSEFGMAIISGKPVILVGHAADKNVFSHHPLVLVTYDTIGDFLKNQKLFRYAGKVRIKEAHDV